MKGQSIRSGLPAIAACFGVAAAQGAEVFFGNLHSHTGISDGSGTPRDAYRHARDLAGLDFLAITEHNHAAAPSRLQSEPELYNGSGSGSLISQARRFTRDGRFVAIYGQEFSSIGSGNHANILEVGEIIRTSDVPNGAWDRLFDHWLPDHPDSQGLPAIILLNHPATSSSPNDREYGIDDFADFQGWRAKLNAHARLINIINGPSHHGSTPGRPSESEYLRYLNLGLHFGPTADQDNHREDWGSAAETRTGVIADALTKPAILEALRARRVYATQDRNLRIIASFNGALIGSRISGGSVPAVDSELTIEIDLSDDDEPNAIYTIDVFADELGGTQEADIIAQFAALDNGASLGNGSHTLPGITYTGGQQYFFLRVKQTDPDHSATDTAWLAPVWFEPDGVSVPAAPMLTLEVNLETERARITNIGSASVDLKDWRLVSMRGNQFFQFAETFVLAPGSAVTIASGPGAVHNPPDTLLWTNAYVWSNAGDPGELRDQGGVIIARSQ
jgi:hypothetical protein